MKNTNLHRQILGASTPNGELFDFPEVVQLSIFEVPNSLKKPSDGERPRLSNVKIGDLDKYRDRVIASLTAHERRHFETNSNHSFAPMKTYAVPEERHHLLEEIGPNTLLHSPTSMVRSFEVTSLATKPMAKISGNERGPILKKRPDPNPSRAKIDLDLLYLVALTMIEKVGPKTSRALLQHFGNAEAIFRTHPRELVKIPSIGEKIAKAIQQNIVLKAAERELDFALKNGINVVTWYEDSFPKKLKAVDDSPLVLYLKGELPAGDRPHIAVVGTRRPSAHGKKIASEFSTYFAERGIVVVSGLAYGIDYESHAATLEAGGCTVAVLGHGLDQIYPRDHASKSRDIVERGGVLLTEFCSGTQPDAYNFPARNRIISGLSDAVLVVEATEKGGALITAKCAFEQDREVFAIPGALGVPTSVGCNRLIRDNIARIACEPGDVLDSLQHLLRFRPADCVKITPKIAAQLSERERQVCQGMEAGLVDMDTIAAKSGIFGSELQSILLGLEFRQIVGRSKGNKFQLL